MTTLLIALFVAFAAGFAGWRVVVARRSADKPTEIAPTDVAPRAEDEPAAATASKQRTPEQEAARATARAKAERVIAAEAA
ncbi:MAG TPA: hypothetical protein VIP05_14030, partial [Burkholderiaceae bacterium]